MIDLMLGYVLPGALTLLPPAMRSENAAAMLLATGLQESRFLHRRQDGGPARGFWQFERAGVEGVLTHHTTQLPIAIAMRRLQFDHTVDASRVLEWLEWNDLLAACFARCLLWTLAGTLAGDGEHEDAWRQYLLTWRPGAPRPETWLSFYAEAWARVRLARPKMERV